MLRYTWLVLIALSFSSMAQDPNCAEGPPPAPQFYGSYQSSDFKKLSDPSLTSYLGLYEARRGRLLTPLVFRPDIYNQGFFIHESGIFMTALHVVGDVIRFRVQPGKPYLAGVTGPRSS